MPKSESGFAPIILIVIAAIAAISGGYLFLSKSGQVPSLPIPGGVTLNPNCKHNDPDLCKFINNWKDFSQYAAKSVTTPKSGPKSEVTFEISGKDKFHMVNVEGGKEIYNLISISDTTYTKDFTDNKWWKQKSPKQTEDIKQQSEFKVEDSSTKPEEDKTTYKKISKEACGPKQCFKYQMMDPNAGDSIEYLWFDDREYLLRKTSSESKELGLTVSEYSYGGINISVPSPIKDASPDQIIVPSGSAVTPVSEEEFKKLQQDAQGDVQKTVPIMREEENNTPAETPQEDSTPEDSSAQ